MIMTHGRRRAAMLAAALGITLLLTLLFPGLTPWSPPALADTTPPGVCGTHYYALDSPKESPFAFGPAVTATDETAIKADLRERRLCGTDPFGDPTLTASHYAEWSSYNLTSHKVEFAGIDAFAASLVADFPLWESVVTEMEALEVASAFSVTDVPAGTASLYMVPDGAGGVTTHQGLTIGNGTAATFTHPSGAVVKFRQECGFQNVRESFPGVPMVPPGTPETPPPPPTTPPLEEKVPSQDPENQGNNKPGGGGQAPPQSDPVGPPAAGTPPVVYTPAPVPPVVTPPVGSTPDPAPAPAPEPEAPTPEAPAEGCSPPPGMATC